MTTCNAGKAVETTLMMLRRMQAVNAEGSDRWNFYQVEIEQMEELKTKLEGK